MTKEQREEMERLANEYAPIERPGDDIYGHDGFIAGFTAGVESEKKRAQVLVETLQIISNEIDECCQFEKALKALAQYQKGGGDE